MRFEHDRSAVVVASSGVTEDVMRVGSRVPLGGEDVGAARLSDRETGTHRRLPGGERRRSRRARDPVGVRGVVATPVLVEGRLWGAMAAGTAQEEPLPPETESRLAQFTELMATAIANTEAHARADRLAQEQAALRRVATLVAKEAPPADVFAKVAEEVGHAFGDVRVPAVPRRGRRNRDASSLLRARLSSAFPVGTRLPTDGDSVTATVLREGRPHRIDDYATASGTIAERPVSTGSARRSAVRSWSAGAYGARWSP